MSADERAALIRGAWTVLERSGFEGFKVQLVMREADVSARQFYRHFADKDELLITLIQDEMSRAGAQLREAVAAAEEPADQVARWVTRVIDAAGDPRRVDRARLFSSQQLVMSNFPEEVRRGTEHVVAPLRAAIERGVETGAFPLVGDAARDASLVYALTGNELREALTEPPDTLLDDRIEATIGFVLRAFGAWAAGGVVRVGDAASE